MLHKWKIILTNWINCYFNETTKKDLPVSLDSLLYIISHLRENLNLDESKSSLLDAHTVQEFMVEKYPDFKFENGTVEPDNDGDVYLVASLLLFFVCVNSKNVDMKSAMCSQLSPGDQEIILKYSKQLMECSKITIMDVQAAIIEACGQEIAAAASSSRVLVAETPPALRSFHSEVRRLQAALDAERFDRTYLQEELNRTIMKVEKLLKDKEQYKLEIVNLKTQIVSGCDQDRESQGEGAVNNTSKMKRELEHMEQKLFSAQEELKDAQDERDTYKTKLHQLKSEHEKLLALSHQESAQANSLAEELLGQLEAERRQNQSLKELVTELRQHNHLNRMDSSMLECDDPDASIQSLQHNSSACSEVCVNVIEVQLGEERAKVLVLKQQIQMLQDQLHENTIKAEEEKKSFTCVISEKESSIMELKHRLNEEIEEKNTLKIDFDNEIAKLNNEFNELEQRLKGSQENSRNIIEKKMQEIQNLQEEKLSLLQSLSDEITKLENIIKDLQYEIDAEKSSKIRLRDEYDSHIMKLNEKVLNRNNELVELQNKILQKGEKIEELQLDLRREKELREDLSNRHNNELIHLNCIREQVEKSLQQKSEEARDLHNHLQQHIVFIEKINKDNDHLKSTILQFQEDCNALKDTKEKLKIEIKNRDVKAEQIYKETENLKNLLCEEKQKLQYNLEETSATVQSLKGQLQNEIQCHVEMQNELRESLNKNSSLTEEIKKLNGDIQKMCFERNESERLIEERNEEIIKVKKSNEILKRDLTDAKAKLGKLADDIVKNNIIIKDLKDDLENNKKLYHENLVAKDKIIKCIENKLDADLSNRNTLEEQCNSLRIEKDRLLGIIKEKDYKLLQMESEYKIVCETSKEQKDTIQSLQLTSSGKAEEYAQLKNKYDIEITNHLTRLDETEKSLKEVMAKSNNVIEGKELLIQTLNVRSEQTERVSKEMQENLLKAEIEKQSLVQQIATEKLNRHNVENEYLSQFSTTRNVNAQLNEEIRIKDEAINSIKKENQSFLETIKEKQEEIKLLEWNLSQTSQNLKDAIVQRDKEIKVLHNNITEIEQSTNNVIEGLKKEINLKLQEIVTLEAENSDLRHRIENINIHNAEMLKDKNSLILDLQKKLDTAIKQVELTDKYFKNERNKFQKAKAEMETNISEKENVIKELSSQITVLNKMLDESKQNEALLSEKDILIQELLEERTIRKIVDEEKQTLLCEKNQIEEQLEKEMNMRILLTREMECITQQLAQERLGKQLAEQEKENLAKNQEEMQKKIVNEIDLKTALEKQNLTLLEKNKLISKEKELLTIKVTELTAEMETLRTQFGVELSEALKHKIDLEKQINNLIKEKDSLIKELTDERVRKNMFKVENERLLQERDNICLEKENLLIENETTQNDLAVFKEYVEQLTNEKYVLNDKIQQSKEKHLSELKEKQDELQCIFSDYMSLKSDYKKVEGSMVEIGSTLDQALQIVKEVMKEEDVGREEMCKSTQENDVDENKVIHKYEHFVELLKLLTTELVMKRNLEETLRQENVSVGEAIKQKELQITQLQAENRNNQQIIEQLKADSSMLREKYNSSLDSKNRDIQTLQDENQTLHNELNDVKVQLDCKVHSLKDKLTDNENLTDKLKKTYDCQIDNLNLMVNKLTNYLKDKTIELDAIRKEKDKLQQIVDDNAVLIRSLHDEVKLLKQDQEKLLSDFESERLVLKNMVTVTESVMEDQKVSLNNIILEHLKRIEALKDENKTLEAMINTEKQNAEIVIKDKVYAIETALKELSDVKNEKAILENQTTSQIQVLTDEVVKFKEEILIKADQIEKLKEGNQELNNILINYKNDITNLEERGNEWKIKKDAAEVELTDKIEKIKKELVDKSEDNIKLGSLLQESQATIKTLNDRVTDIEFEKNECVTKLEEIKEKLEVTAHAENEELSKLKHEYKNLLELMEVQKSEIIKLESLLMYEKQQNELQQEDNNNEKLTLSSKCGILQEYQIKAEQELERRQKEINSLTAELKELREKSDKNIKDKDELIELLRQEKDSLISKFSKEFIEERDKWMKESESKAAALKKLTQRLEEVTRSETDTVKLLRKENEVLKKTLALKESFAVASQEKSSYKSATQGDDVREQHQQVDTTPTDHTPTSFESYKTISDLETILQDRNRTITALQTDITYLKSLMAESENKLLDVTKDLEVSKENCHQLSNQLKKIVHQKNEEIADLKKQLMKMSVTENRASQIIKVSAKYQAIILKRIAEIKSNTVLKELTNFGNTTNGDNELRRNLTAGTVTMEDLENFLDTTDKHIKRCSERQLVLQKERDRLIEVNRINESEIINMRKFLTELSVSIKTFNTVKEVYTQKLSRVVSLQRTVRRDILGLDGHITDVTMCKLERGYAAVMQDLSECAMNLERWVERSIGRAISTEKLKQAFSSEERPSLATATFQNTSLEVQLDELENSFCKLLEEVARAQKGEGAKDAEAVTVMEVRAEYEEKLNRMKAKMKQLYQEQMGIFKEKQKDEVAALQKELQKARGKLEESSRAYEEHIRSLTTELWNVGEKFLMKKDEAEWLRRKQRSGSLMSLQHVHSSGLVPPQEEPSRTSDAHSLRSLPVTSNTSNKNEGRTLHMSDEEGEVFDNRCLRELATPSRAARPPGQRLSELQWRNSLCPPHLKSSYPAETQFVPAVHEEEIKCVGGPSMSLGGRPQRKEVGITAYKKPGPPTPSKQAGRLSATDSELRESLRVETEPNASRKTSTPSRIRALFRSNKGDNAEGTPRSRRLSNIFRKK